MRHWPDPTCRHRGAAMPLERVECKSPLRAAPPEGVPRQACMSCPVRDQGLVGPPVLPAPTAGQIRHLTYHLYPEGTQWRPNVEQLAARLSLFNGRRIIAVTQGDGAADVGEVKAALGPADAEFLVLPNHRTRREMVSHMLMIEALQEHRGAGDVTFYGHGKGISTSGAHGGVVQWREAMYRGCLDYWPRVQRELRTAAAVGCYRRLWYPPSGTRVPWHFSGSFRWLRNADLYAREWRSIDEGWCGGEAYPGRHFRQSESACLFGEFQGGELGLYLKSEWDGWAQAAADQFYSAAANDRWAPQLFTVILTAHGQRELVHDAIRSVQAQTSDSWQCLVVHSGLLHDPAHFARYKDDARVQLMATGETPADSQARCGQSWAINEAWRRGRVRGDLILHLSDDDVLAPDLVRRALELAAAAPRQSAWYGPADRVRLLKDGREQCLTPLQVYGAGSPSNLLRGRVDGMQVWHRREVRIDWPEQRELRMHADGWWMDALSSAAVIHPVCFTVGKHRHTPLSTFTS